MIQTLDMTSAAQNVAVSDFNNDNYLDLIITLPLFNIVNVVLSYCCDPFLNQRTINAYSGLQPYSIAVGDFNIDNRLDLVVDNEGTNNGGILLSYENDTFTDQATFDIGSGSHPNAVVAGRFNNDPHLNISVAIGDFNSDTYLDIAMNNDATNHVGILFGYGNGSFADVMVFTMRYKSQSRSLTVID